jgi:transcriptional regulator with AAA-type ATPase domain
MQLSRRFLVLSLGLVGYVGVAAIRATSAEPSTVAAAVGVPVGLFLLLRLTQPSELTEDVVSEPVRQAVRWTAVGAAIYLTARSAGPGRAAFDAAAAAGVGIAGFSSLFAMSRVPEAKGALPCSPAARRLDGAFAFAILSAIAVTVPAAAALTDRGANIDPLTIDYTMVAQGFAGLLLLTLSSLRFARERRLELGVADRGSAALVVSATLLAITTPAAALSIAAPDRLAPGAMLLAALAIGAAMSIRDATLVGRALRVLLVLSVIGAPVALFAASVAAAAPRFAGGTILLAGATLLILGVFAEALASRLSPDGARWLGALVDAQGSATLADPHTALRATLGTLRHRLGQDAPSPVLYRFDAGDAVSVDRAGYLHETPAAPPPDALALCEAEEAHTLRLAVVRALEVRSPHVRPTLAWMEAHGYTSVTVVFDDEGPVGLLALPKGKRRTSLTLAEVQAVERLTQRLASVLALSSSLAAARARQQAAEEDARLARVAQAEAESRLSTQGARHQLAAAALARRAKVGRYSPAARLVAEELERRSRGRDPLVFLAPPGTDVRSFAAALHLGSDRASGPLVFLDGADPMQEETLFAKDVSPLLLAQGGTLVIEHLPGLHRDRQRSLALLLREGTARLGDDQEQVPVDVRIVATVHETIDALVGRDRLVEELADVLGDRSLPLPALASRSEDLRSMAMEILGHAGMALRGVPLGIAPDALAELLEHGFPVNDQELSTILLAAAIDAKGITISASDLERAGFVAQPLEKVQRRPEREQSALEQAVRGKRRSKSS